MSKVKLYIATSLDGKIARPDGSVAWLDEHPHPEGADYGYTDFYATLGAVVMGRKTYEEVLGFDVPWPYSEKRSYVFTTQENYAPSTPDTFVLSSLDSLEEVKTTVTGDTWIVGGGQLIALFLRQSLIDEMTLTVFPKILGQGIPLFPAGIPETDFTLRSAEAFSNGLVNLLYDHVPSSPKQIN
ncbi:MAG: dihydrofolate reductase family protein [Bacteroidota bacterium]